MRPGIDPKVDYAFKKLFGTEATRDLLANILAAVLQPPPGHEIVDLTLLNPFNEKEAFDDKLSVVDVKARDASGRQFTVEMQMVGPPHFPQRALYYWATLYQQQLREAMAFSDLRPTFSICFLNNELYPGVNEYHHSFELIDPRTGLVLTDDLAIHLLELPKFAQGPEELSTALGVWCYFLRHGDTLDSANLPKALDIPPIRRALEILTVLSQTDLERERYLARMRVLRDEISMARALQEARAGAERGELIGRIHLSQRLLKHPQTQRETLLARSLEELTRLADELEAKLSPPAS